MVGSQCESSNATGINGDQADTSAPYAGAVYVFLRTGVTWSQQAYLKPSNTQGGAFFGISIALSGDTLAVGAEGEASAATGVNGVSLKTATNSGAVYVFTRAGATWSQQAYVKASNTRASATFGHSVALSGDTLAVGSPLEGSGSSGINGDQAATPSLAGVGAVYVFTRADTTWSQQAYVKASNSRSETGFGGALALEGDTLAVGAVGDSSAATGVGGNESDTTAPGAGAVYVFTRAGVVWSQQAYVKASNARQSAAFGSSLALSGDRLAVGAIADTSKAVGVNGDPSAAPDRFAGAAYLFDRRGATWSQQAYVKASYHQRDARYGSALALSDDTLAVAAVDESSGATGVNGDQSDTSATYAGAVYVLR